MLLEWRTAEDKDLKYYLNMKDLPVGEQFIYRLHGFVQRRVIVEERPGQPWTHRLIVQDVSGARTDYIFDAIAAPGFSSTLETYRRKYKLGVEIRTDETHLRSENETMVRRRLSLDRQPPEEEDRGELEWPAGTLDLLSLVYVLRNTDFLRNGVRDFSSVDPKMETTFPLRFRRVKEKEGARVFEFLDQESGVSRRYGPDQRTLLEGVFNTDSPPTRRVRKVMVWLSQDRRRFPLRIRVVLGWLPDPVLQLEEWSITAPYPVGEIPGRE